MTAARIIHLTWTALVCFAAVRQWPAPGPDLLATVLHDLADHLLLRALGMGTRAEDVTDALSLLG